MTTSQRTDTSGRTSLNRTNQAILSFDTSSPSSYVTTISLFHGTAWTSGLHWHETHTEYLQVVKGRVLVQIGNSKQVCGPDAGVLQINTNVRHEWGSASGPQGNEREDAEEDDEFEVVVREWTEPCDGQKEIFFRNLMSILEDQSKYRFKWMIPVQLFTTFGVMDNYPVVVQSNSKTVEKVVTYTAISVASLIADFIGIQGVYREYTPKPLWDIWKGGNSPLKNRLKEL